MDEKKKSRCYDIQNYVWIMKRGASDNNHWGIKTHGVWAIAMVTFDVPWVIYAHNMPVDSVYIAISNYIFKVFTVNTN